MCRPVRNWAESVNGRIEIQSTKTDHVQPLTYDIGDFQAGQTFVSCKS